MTGTLNAWVFSSGGGRQSTARTLMGAANRRGVLSAMAQVVGGDAVFQIAADAEHC